jgi:hypothetical protein
MTIEIRSPELEALILQRMEQGGFHDVEDALMQALQESPTVNGDGAKSDDQRTGAELIKALQSSPYREVEIEPDRVRLLMPLRDVTL